MMIYRRGHTMKRSLAFVSSTSPLLQNYHWLQPRASRGRVYGISSQGGLVVYNNLTNIVAVLKRVKLNINNQYYFRFSTVPSSVICRVTKLTNVNLYVPIIASSAI